MTDQANHIIERQLMGAMDRIAPPWSVLKNKRLFLTGGSGFFGLWILSAINILNRDYNFGIRCDVLTRSARLQASLPFLVGQHDFRLIESDVRSVDLSGRSYDIVIHAATTSARETFDGASSLDKFELLVDGTRNVSKQFEFLRCKRAVFLSSGVAYGPSKFNRPFSEKDLNAPCTIAAETGLAHGKRAAEFIFSEYCKRADISFKIARCFSFVGAGLPHDLHYAIGNFISSALAQQNIIIQSDGQMVRSYMDMRDFVIWLGLLLGSQSKEQIYNIGSEEAVTIGDLAKLIVRILKSNVKISTLGNKSHTVGNEVRSYYVPCTQLFHEEFKPPTSITLEIAIRDYAEYLSTLGIKQQ